MTNNKVHTPLFVESRIETMTPNHSPVWAIFSDQVYGGETSYMIMAWAVISGRRDFGGERIERIVGLTCSGKSIVPVDEIKGFLGYCTVIPATLNSSTDETQSG